MKNAKAKECYEDNNGGLTIVWRGEDDKIKAAAWGLERQTNGDGAYDMVEWDDYMDCTGTSCGWVDTDNSDGVVSVDSIQQDIDKYGPTGDFCLVATYDGHKLTLYPDTMGVSAKKYFKIK